MITKYLSTFTILAFSAAQAFAWWESGTQSNPAQWSSSSLSDGNTVDLELYSKNPTPAGENYFNVDADITLKTLKSVWLSSNQVLSMEKSDGTFGSITIDTAKSASNGDVQTISLRGTEPYGQNSLIFKNGRINIVNTNSAYTPTAMIRLAENSTSSANNKVLTFEKDTTLNSELNIKVEGTSTVDYPTRSVINLNGTLNALTTLDSKNYYKELSFIRSSGSPYGNVVANFGESSVTNVGKLSFQQGTTVNIAAGAVININTKNQSYAADSNNVYFGKDVVANINGSITVASQGSMHGFNIDGATLIVGAEGSMSTSDGGYRNIQLQGQGTLDISATATNAVSAGDGLRLNGGKLILRSENGVKNMTLWIYKASNNKIEVYNKVRADGLAFVNEAQLEITLAADAELWLSSFSTTRGGGWADYLDSSNSLNIINFANYKIHVGSYRADDDLSRIFAENVEEGSFYWEADTENGGYWLNANVIPEPATIAAIFGALVLAFAIYRRRK